MPGFIENFHFIRPIYFLLTIAIAIVIVAYAFQIIGASSWSKHINKRYAPYLLTSGKRSSRRLSLTVLSIILLLSVFSLAGPAWIKIPVPLKVDNAPLVIVWDLSPSMLAEDLKPSRTTRARLKIADFLQTRKEGQTALVVYAGDAHVVTPLTDDIRTIENLLNGLDPKVMPIAGSNIEMAMELANNLLEEVNVTKGSIVVLTDGIDESARNELIMQQNSLGHKLTFWAFGTAEGAPIRQASGGFIRKSNGDIYIAQLDESQLSSIASSLGAFFVPMSSDDLDIRSINSFSKSSSLDELKDTDQTMDFWHEHGPLLLLPLILLFPMLFRRGWLVTIVLGVTLQPTDSVYAVDIPDALKSKDQKGYSLFIDGEHQEALSLFTDPSWQAAAAYKAGDYELAESLYSKGRDSQSLFNLGNSLAKQQRYEDALAAYESALKLDNTHKSALKNKEIIERLLDQESKDQESKDQESKDQESKDQESKDQESKDQESKDQESKDQESKDQESKDQESKDQESKDQESKDQESEEDKQSQEQKNNPITDEDREKLDEFYNKPKPKNDIQEQEQEESQMTEAQQRERDEKMQEQVQLSHQLNRVPDNPGELLRRKFESKSLERQRQMSRSRNTLSPDQQDRL
ncbi:MAG: Ca-activated chloride channel family protein [Flavobacteriales bacterium]|jgi:Ca-activated chloride channel family protein